VRARVSAEDELWEVTAQFFWWAERFGWTPDQVEALPLFVRERMAGVAAMHDELRAEREKG